MEKHIVIFVMSPFNNRGSIKYKDTNSEFISVCEHTNEVSLKYIEWKLKQDNKKIENVYAFVSDEVEKDVDRFKKLFIDCDFDIKAIPLYNNGDLSGSFKSISAMSDILQSYISKNKVTIHLDMTGGPRHAVMLMMALIQMIKFTGAKVGMVTYANILKGKTEGIIEDTHELMDMFTLISGAEEFVAVGNVAQIQKYFASRKDNSLYLNNVLNSMENLSETIRICGSYKSMENTLADLANSIKTYEKFYLEKIKRLSDQELFFGKLLPTIKSEYAEIMPNSGKSATPIQIIKWCAKRNFLQAAITFYTEWLPVYLIDNGLVIINDKHVEEYCKRNRIWLNWQVYFLKNYEKRKSGKKKSEKRREIFKKMIEDNIIEIKLPEEQLLKFVEEYIKYVNNWRNQVNHANSSAATKDSNFNIAQDIINSVSLIE